LSQRQRQHLTSAEQLVQCMVLSSNNIVWILLWFFTFCIERTVLDAILALPGANQAYNSQGMTSSIHAVEVFYFYSKRVN
jgi:hypothetical protein